jgi:hypothetical protein
MSMPSTVGGTREVLLEALAPQCVLPPAAGSAPAAALRRHRRRAAALGSFRGRSKSAALMPSQVGAQVDVARPSKAIER